MTGDNKAKKEEDMRVQNTLCTDSGGGDEEHQACEKRENAVVQQEIKYSSSTCSAEEGKMDHYTRGFVAFMGETERVVN